MDFGYDVSRFRGRSHMEFGAWLARNRKMAGLTQRKLAKSAHLSPGYLALLEAGTVDPPPLKTCRRLALALGLVWQDVRPVCIGFRLQNWLQQEVLSRITNEEVDLIVRVIASS